MFKRDTLDRIATNQVFGSPLPFGLKVISTELVTATAVAADYTVTFKDVIAGTGFFRFTYRHNYSIGEVAAVSDDMQVYPHATTVTEYREYAA